MALTPFRIRACAAALLVLAATSAGAQVTAGRIAGLVTDRSGSAIVAAAVEMRATDGSVPVSLTTGTDGRFSVDTLMPGRYVVSASAPGFDVSRREVVVGTRATTTLDMVLDIARQAVTIEVTARASERPLEVVSDPRMPRQPIPAHDGADYLKTIPGFSVIRKGGTDGDPVLRGLAGSRLGLLLDGEGVLGGCGNRMDPPTAYAFPEAYDRITVLKGPQTVKHGPGNSAGVVLFERDRSPGAQRGLRLYASPTIGSFGRNDQAADIKLGGRKVYTELSATRSTMDDYVDGRGRAVHSAYERWSTNAIVGVLPDASSRVEISGALSDGDAAYADRAMDGVRFARSNLGLRIERSGLSHLIQHVEGQAFYNYVDHVMDNYSLRPFAATGMMPNRSVSNPDRRTIGGRLSSNLRVSGTTLATLGVEWQENRHALRSSANQVNDPYDVKPRMRDASFENLGGYAEVTQAVGARSHLVAGIRGDWWTGRDARQTVSLGMGVAPVSNPTAGLERRETLVSGFARYEQAIDSGTTIYAGVGRVGRAPDFWELVSKESAGSVSAFSIRPEHTTQVDAGVLYRVTRVSGSVAFFANRIDDFILVQSNVAKMAMGGMGAVTRKATIARNIDASMWGGEATVAVNLARSLAADMSVAYTRGRNNTDNLPLAQQPPLEGRLGLTYSGDRWSAGALARLVAAQDRYAVNQGNIVGQDLGPAPAFAIVSMNGRLRVTKILGISAGIDNMLDATYAEFISRGGASVPGFLPTTRVNEPGRTLWVKLDVRK